MLFNTATSPQSSVKKRNHQKTTMKISALILLMIASLFSLGFAEDEDHVQEVDHLASATLMIYDGRLDEAEAELARVDKSGKNFNAADYYTARGVLYFKKSRYESAISNYKKAITATKTKKFESSRMNNNRKYLFSIGKNKDDKDPVFQFDSEKEKQDKLEKLNIYLSQSYYEIKDYANTIKHLDLAGDRGRDRTALFALRAECYWKIKKFNDAINSLSRGLKLFPEDPALLKQKYYYLSELGLYQAAIENAKKYMTVINADADEFVILAQLLVKADQTDEAIKILETARGKFPKIANIAMLLGHIYMQKDMKHTAAHLFKAGACNDKKYLKDAVEMHRQIKDYSHAIFLNAQMSDNVEKLKQKVAIHVERSEFEKVIGLKDGLERYNILEDDNIRYALAYSYYMSKDYQNAELQLNKIDNDELYLKGAAIRRNIEKCRKNSVECF